MLYDFDKPVERRGTYSAKWDGIPLFSAAGISERGVRIRSRCLLRTWTSHARSL